jgi:hypothetical protein
MSIYDLRVYRGIFKVRIRGEGGISLIAVTVIMLIAATLALVIASVMSSANISSMTDMQAQQALYIAQAGLEWYTEQLEGDSDWSSPPAVKTDEAFGAGTFSVSYDNEAADTIDVTATGKVTAWDGNDVQRVTEQHIEKSSGGTTFADFAIFYGGGDGSITSDIAKNQTITGDTFIHGDLDIGKNCTITGDVLATGEISVGSGTNISGDTTEYADPPANQPTLTTTYYDGLITTASGEAAGDRDFEAETISGTIYVNGDVEINDYIDGSGIIVATGEVDIKSNTDIGDDITIICDDSFLMRKNGTVGTTVTFYSSSDLTINNGVVLGSGAGAGEGVIILSPGDITLNKNITMTGFVFGDDVTVSAANLDLTGNLSGNRLIELTQGAVIVKDSTKVDHGSIQGFDTGEEVTITTSLWQESL